MQDRAHLRRRPAQPRRCLHRSPRGCAFRDGITSRTCMRRFAATKSRKSEVHCDAFHPRPSSCLHHHSELQLCAGSEPRDRQRPRPGPRRRSTVIRRRRCVDRRVGGGDRVLRRTDQGLPAGGKWRSRSRFQTPALRQVARRQIVLFLDADAISYPAAVSELLAQWSDDTAQMQFRLHLVDEICASGHLPAAEVPFDSGDVTPQLASRARLPDDGHQRTGFCTLGSHVIMPVPEPSSGRVQTATLVSSPRSTGR